MLLQACVKHARDDSDFYLAYYTAEYHKRKANRYHFIDINFARIRRKVERRKAAVSGKCRKKYVMRQIFFSDGFILARSASSLNGEISKTDYLSPVFAAFSKKTKPKPP
jgi:hypothetical protein